MADAILNQSGIYAIRNTITGKLYVGSAVNIEKRNREHFRLLRLGKHHSPALQGSWLKHGEAAFVVEMLESVVDKYMLVFCEQKWIDALDTFHGGYNATPKAGSMLGFKQSDEAIEKMASAKRGVKQSPEVIEKRAAALRGRKYTDEHKAKISAAFQERKSRPGYIDPNTGRKHSPEHVAKYAAAHRGHRHTEESKARISKGRAGIIPVRADPIAWAKSISVARKGYKMPDSTKEKLRNVAKAQWERKRGNPLSLAALKAKYA